MLVRLYVALLSFVSGEVTKGDSGVCRRMQRSACAIVFHENLNLDSCLCVPGIAARLKRERHTLVEVTTTDYLIVHC